MPHLVYVIPTVLAILGLAVPSQFRGRILIALMEGRVDEARAAVSEVGYLRAWTEGPCKLIVNPSTGAESLYQLATDPGEQHDLHRSIQRPRKTLAFHSPAEVLNDNVALTA
jgi:arylsulfatase A-like enzyme